MKARESHSKRFDGPYNKNAQLKLDTKYILQNQSIIIGSRLWLSERPMTKAI